MMVKNFFILQLGVKMKKSKRYIKKQTIKELKLAGYGNGEGGPNDWMYRW